MHILQIGVIEKVNSVGREQERVKANKDGVFAYKRRTVGEDRRGTKIAAFESKNFLNCPIW